MSVRSRTHGQIQSQPPGLTFQGCPLSVYPYNLAHPLPECISTTAPGTGGSLDYCHSAPPPMLLWHDPGVTPPDLHSHPRFIRYQFHVLLTPVPGYFSTFRHRTCLLSVYQSILRLACQTPGIFRQHSKAALLCKADRSVTARLLGLRHHPSHPNPLR